MRLFLFALPPFLRGAILTLGSLSLCACSDTQRLEADLKALKTSEIELQAQLAKVSLELTVSRTTLKQLEKASRQGADGVSQDTKLGKLQTQLTYLQSASQSVAEQTKSLEENLAAYQAKYLGK